MNKKELVAALAKESGFSLKDSTKAVECLMTVAKEALLDGEKITLIGFGTMAVRDRAPKIGRNPRTGEEVKIGATKVPVFKAGKELKEALNA